jgi:hypothetical protein
MSIFRAFAYLSPLILGFGLPAALALSLRRTPAFRAKVAGGLVAGVLVLLLLASFGDSPRLWLPLAVLLVSFSLLVTGLYLLLESAGVSREVSQIATGLVVCLLMSTLFIAGPIIRDSADAGATGEAISRRITLSLAVNPSCVMGYSIFQADLLYLPIFYRWDLAGFQHDKPGWTSSSVGYAVAGILMGALSLGARRLHRQ